MMLLRYNREVVPIHGKSEEVDNDDDDDSDDDKEDVHNIQMWIKQYNKYKTKYSFKIGKREGGEI